MSTRSSARNLFPPLDNPELTIRRISRSDPTLLNNYEMAAEGNGDLPVPDLRTIEELCQPSLNVQNSCQFHGLPGDDANKHFDKFLHVTQRIKVNGVTDDALRLYLCWVIISINHLNLLTVSFGVDVAIELEEKHQVFNAASRELSAAKHKLMLLDTAAERRLLLLS
nr:hypothetical protein [Tanacetum cinerariifolium]